MRRAQTAAGPMWVYDIWSAQTNGIFGPDDDTSLTEELAFRELEQILRYRAAGVELHAFMLNYGWYSDEDGGYRRWRSSGWPQGPDRWLAACERNDILVGLWIGGNTLWRGDAPPEWADSLAEEVDGQWPPFRGFSFSDGGFLPHLMETLQIWYDRGVRLFEMDNANLNAATPRARADRSPDEIRRRNRDALADALAEFRARNPDVVIVAFNGFGGPELDALEEQRQFATTSAALPQGGMIDPSWLDVFDTVYSGDIRVSDVPMANFWRSVDLYGDHMVRRYEQSGIPLDRTESFFTLSTTGFGYYRRNRAWRSMLILTEARGGWKKTVYGNLELLGDDDIRWCARVQRLFDPLHAAGRASTFGGVPGEATEPYGFVLVDEDGALCTVVNPTQSVASVDLPIDRDAPARVIFGDAGGTRLLRDATLTLGPEQLLVVATGKYATPENDLGIEPDSRIPTAISALPIEMVAVGEAPRIRIAPTPGSDIRIVVRRTGADGAPLKGSLPEIRAWQGTREIDVPVPEHDVRAMRPGRWMLGASWRVAEIRADDLDPAQPLLVDVSDDEDAPRRSDVVAYAVRYDSPESG